MNNPFGSVPVAKKGRTLFPLDHSISGTFALSKVQPVFFTDTLPGDSWKINAFNLTKLETLIAPAMQPIDASLLWFKIPKRLCFKHFKKWYSGGEDGEDKHEKPHIHLFAFINNFMSTLHSEIANDDIEQAIFEQVFGPGSLWNYLGLPSLIKYDDDLHIWRMIKYKTEFLHNPSDPGDSDFIDLIPLIGYNMLYDTYFRDQSLSTPVFTDAEEGVLEIQERSLPIVVNGHEYYLDDYFSPSGDDLSEGGVIGFNDVIYLLFMFNRAYKKDYFTSALPSSQRGPEVRLNLGDVESEVEIPAQTATLLEPRLLSSLATDTQFGEMASDMQQPGIGDISAGGRQMVGIQGSLNKLTGTAIASDLSPLTITAFRNLFKLQAFLEKNNVGGGRYIETILAQWGERVPDFTVQRPQFIRATSIPVQINEVTATANTSGFNSLVGDQAGRARTQGNLGSVSIYTHEPSLIFGLYCVTVPPSYADQGISRHWQRVTRFDEAWTDFQHIGEQNIKKRELRFNPANVADNDKDFGYQQRFSEFKYIPSRVVGDFITSKAFWHMARLFNTTPGLNNDFITQNPDPRIFAVQDGRPVTADFFFKCVAKRKLSKFSTPKLT